MDSHLEHVPCLRTFSVGCLSGGDLEDLGWETDWALDAEFLGLGAVDELGADFLEGLDVLGGEGDADLSVRVSGGGLGMSRERRKYVPCGPLGLRRSLYRLCCRTFL